MAINLSNGGPENAIIYTASNETNPMTISMWFVANSWYGYLSGGGGTGIPAGHWGSAQGWILGGVGTNVARLYFRHEFSTTQGQWYIASPSLGVLHRLTITYDGSATANNPVVYVDGKSVSVVRAQSPSGTQTLASSQAIRIGDLGGGEPLDGKIQDLCINYGTILTANQELSIYNAKSAPASNGLYTFRDPLLTASTSSTSGSIYPFGGATLTNGINYTLDMVGGLVGTVSHDPVGASDIVYGTGY